MLAVELRKFPWTSSGPQKYEAIPDEGTLEEGSNGLIQTSTKWPRRRIYALLVMFPLSLLCLVLISNSLIERDALLSTEMRVSDVPFDIVEHPEAPTKFWGDRVGPLPTGAFWTNFVVENGDAPANLHPYGIKCVEDGIQASYNPTRRVVNELVVSDPFDNDLQITAEESYIDRAVSNYDSLSVTMKYEIANQGSYSAHLVKGAAFVTVSFNQATPIVKAPNMQIINAELRDSSGKKVADMEDGNEHRQLMDDHSHDFSSGVQYLLDLGNFQKWLVYVSDPKASLIWDKAGNKMTASGGPSDAFVRVAILPPRKDEESIDAACAYLLKYVHNYPVGATVDLDYDKSGTLGVMSYHFATEGLAGKMKPSSDTGSGSGVVQGWWAALLGLLSGGSHPSSSGHSGQSPDSDSPSEAAANADILMYALPHHVKALDSADGTDILSQEGHRVLPSLYSLKGPLSPVVGSTWTMKYRLADKGWDYYVRSDVPSSQLDEIATQLIEDIANTPTESIAADSYNVGKEVGRMARLAGIADYLGIMDQREQALSKLRTWLQPWLEGTNDDNFVYDRSYGGIVTTKGLADKMADFGLGYYNDHHFHYGYFVYAFAMVSRFDRDFLRRHQPAMDSVAHDICSHHGVQGAPSSSSSYAAQGSDEAFPYVRHKDFFDGHSWASGIFSMANGKGQESSSEATNAYYACYLYGMVKGDDAMRQHSQFMLTLEVASTKMYWHMPNAEVYDSYFASNAMVGNVGAFDVTSTTWFGSNLEYVHGIQIMPVTPASGLLLEPDFVKVEWPLLAHRLPPSQRGTSIRTGEDKAQGSSHRQLGASGEKTCQAIPRCAALGLTGDCCPNTDGKMLDCCGARTPSPPVKKEEQQQQQQETIDAGDSGITEEWRAVLFMDMAVVDRESAYQQLTKLSDVGPGASKTNALMWAVSRPDPTPLEIPAHEAEHRMQPECKRNSACDASGMLGECCPGGDGGILACCPKVTGATNTRRY